MENLIAIFKTHWDTILITVLSIVIFFLVFRSKARKDKYRNN